MMRAFDTKTDSHRKGGPYSRRVGVSGRVGAGWFPEEQAHPVIFRNGFCCQVFVIMSCLSLKRSGRSHVSAFQCVMPDACEVLSPFLREQIPDFTFNSKYHGGF